MWAKKQNLEPDMEKLIGSKLGKGYNKVAYCHPTLLNYMQSASCKIPIWMNHKLESITRRNIDNLKHEDDATLMVENEEELKRILMTLKEDSEKVGLKLNIQNTNIITSGPITLWKIEREKVETVTDFIFVGSKITVDGDCSHEIKDACTLGEKL